MTAMTTFQVLANFQLASKCGLLQFRVTLQLPVTQPSFHSDIVCVVSLLLTQDVASGQNHKPVHPDSLIPQCVNPVSCIIGTNSPASQIVPYMCPLVVFTSADRFNSQQPARQVAMSHCLFMTTFMTLLHHHRPHTVDVKAPRLLFLSV